MHGCPPDEIEAISTYLLRKRHLHTLVKCNPTLLGPERVRTILNNDLKFADVVVPDIAFEHDLKFSDAVPMFGNLRTIAKRCGLEFGVKLSNTLEVENRRPIFDSAETMSYLSGRPLHAVTVNLAHALADEFDGDLPMSFSAGTTSYNAPDLLAAGMQTITICSDLLKTGGYLRLLDCVESVNTSFALAGAESIEEFILRSAGTDALNSDRNTAAQLNLRRYADISRTDPNNIKEGFDTSHTKTSRPLDYFDCIKAPCVDKCPLSQQVPRYMRAVQQGDLVEAQHTVYHDNPLPCILGRVCDHLCEQACVRTHIDDPLAIRDIKRFIMDRPSASDRGQASIQPGKKVAIIGAGPGGMSAAAELAQGGLTVEIFEQHAYPGGMVGGAVPKYRLPQAVFDQDFGVLEETGRQGPLQQARGPGRSAFAVAPRRL